MRLNDEKVLAWLKKKAVAVAAKLASQYSESVVATFKRDAPTSNEEGGSSSSMKGAEEISRDESNSTATATAASSSSSAGPPAAHTGELEFALGMLSEYLSASWTEKLAAHLGVRTPDEVGKDMLTPTITTDNYKQEVPSKEDLSKKRKAEAALTTHGQRALKKVDTSKMKSITSFFGKAKTKA